ncbi:hypothetical protein FACHB389_13830 [Nostoc calcicola FACHB-389]|nr:hypothetical protein FACHB389_13830 [Nostoc calcicola FACHB-389]
MLYLTEAIEHLLRLKPYLFIGKVNLKSKIYSSFHVFEPHLSSGQSIAVPLARGLVYLPENSFKGNRQKATGISVGVGRGFKPRPTQSPLQRRGF